MSLSIGTWCHCRYCDWIIRRIGDLHLPLPSSLRPSTSLLCPTTDIGLCSTTTCHLCCPTIRSTSTLRPTCCVCGCTTTTIPTIVSTTTTTSWNLCSNAIKEQNIEELNTSFFPFSIVDHLSLDHRPAPPLHSLFSFDSALLQFDALSHPTPLLSMFVRIVQIRKTYSRIPHSFEQLSQMFVGG